MAGTGRNPFEYGRERRLGELVDREAEPAELRATIRNRGKLFLIGPRRFGMSASNIQGAPKSLEAKHLIRPQQDRGEVRYRLVDPFFAAWLADAQAV